MRTLKKYPNRRLYDTSQSCYVTIDNVRDLVLKYERFRVIDSKSDEDLTRSVLLQIIMEQENDSAEHVLTNEVLQHLVRLCGSNSQNDMAQFLEQSISFFLSQQEMMQDKAQVVISENTRVRMIHNISAENIKLWDSISRSIFIKKSQNKQK